MLSDDPNTKGDIGEVAVKLALLKGGFVVYSAVNKSARADLIVMDSLFELYKVQIKCTSSANGKACLPLRKMCLNAKYNSVYTTNEVDVFALYVEDVDMVCFISSAEALTNRTQVTFRLEVAGNGQSKNVRMASDYARFPIRGG